MISPHNRYCRHHHNHHRRWLGESKSCSTRQRRGRNWYLRFEIRKKKKRNIDTVENENLCNRFGRASMIKAHLLNIKLLRRHKDNHQRTKQVQDKFFIGAQDLNESFFRRKNSRAEAFFSSHFSSCLVKVVWVARARRASEPSSFIREQ